MIKTTQFPSFAHVCYEQASQKADQKCFTYLSDGETDELILTYGDLFNRATQIAGAIAEVASPGDRILLICMPGLDYITSLFGCLFAKVTAVPAYPPRSNHHYERIDHIISDVGAKVGVTTSSAIPSLRKIIATHPTMRKIKWVVLDDVSTDTGPVCNLDINPNDLAIIQYTSGSTTTPRGVMLTHKNLMENSHMIINLFQTNANDTGCFWLPPYHDMGLIGGILQPLFVGGHTVLMSPVAFLQRPVRWLWAISRYQTTISVAPNFAYEFCAEKITQEDLTGLNLSSWQIAASGAEMVRAKTFDKFVGKFKSYGFNPNAFYACYGLAEATLIVTGGKRGQQSKGKQYQDRTLISCGKTTEECIVKIIDSQTGVTLPDEQEGEIIVSGPGIANGYWANKDLTEKTFRFRADADSEREYLRTGDLGFISEGELFVTGRLKDLIIIRGRNFYSHDIEEAVVASHEALLPSGGAAFSAELEGEEKLVVIHEVSRAYRKKDLTEVAAAIQQCVTEKYQVSPALILLVLPATIPKTSSGKIQRYECRKRLLENTFEALYTWRDNGESEYLNKAASEISEMSSFSQLSINEILRWLSDQIARKSGAKPASILPSSSILSLGLDSLKLAELQTSVESAFNIKLSLDLLLEDQAIETIAENIFTAQKRVPTLQPLEISPDQGSAANRTLLSPLAESQGAPLSYCQKRMWYIQSLSPESSAYNIGLKVLVAGKLDNQMLLEAVRKLVSRHVMLRTVYKLKDDQILQTPLENYEISIETRDYSDQSYESSADTIDLESRRQTKAHFKLDSNLPFRICLLQFADNKTVMIFVVHHIAFDGWSGGVFLSEFTNIYLSLTGKQQGALPEITHSYYDFARSEQEWLNRGFFQSEREYWKGRLDREMGDAAAPTTYQTKIPIWSGSRLNFSVSGKLLKQIDNFSKMEKTTQYIVFLTGLFILLRKKTGIRDLIIASMFANRKEAEIKNTIGFFANTVLISASLTDELSVSQLVKKIWNSVKGALENQALPYEEILLLNPGSKASYQAGLQVMFVYQDFASWEIDIPGYRIEFEEIETGHARFDLLIALRKKRNGDVSVAIEYRDDIFTNESVLSLRKNYEEILTSMIDDSRQGISQLSASSSFIIAPPVAAGARSQVADHEYDSGIEQELREIFAEVLGLEAKAISRNDNFFALGGDSLRGVQMILRLQKTFSLNLTVKELLENPSISTLGQLILAHQLLSLSGAEGVITEAENAG